MGLLWGYTVAYKYGSAMGRMLLPLETLSAPAGAITSKLTGGKLLPWVTLKPLNKP